MSERFVVGTQRRLAELMRRLSGLALGNAAERALRTRGSGPEELSVCGIGRRRRARCDYLQFDRLGEAYLPEILMRIADPPITHIEELLPWQIAASLPPAIEPAA